MCGVDCGFKLLLGLLYIAVRCLVLCYLVVLSVLADCVWVLIAFLFWFELFCFVVVCLSVSLLCANWLLVSCLDLIVCGSILVICVWLRRCLLIWFL